MFLINGIERDTLAASDRAIQFGDGCFTTARIVGHQVQMLPAHLRRLQLACAALMIPYAQWQQLEAEMQRLALEQQSGVLKVILTRGRAVAATAARAVRVPHVSSAFQLIPPIMRAGKKPALR